MHYFSSRRQWTGDPLLHKGFFYGVFDDKLLMATKDLQQRLNILLGTSTLVVDGDYGPATTSAVRQFQKRFNLRVTGVIDHPNWMTLVKHANKNTIITNSYDKRCLNLGKRRFVVFVDAGHGGLNNQLQYTTAGKRAYHKEVELHHKGMYYEGHENRIAAEAFINSCTEQGILCIRTYHPVEDWPLAKRAEIVRDWLDRGYYGYLHSFHSNAISSRNSQAKLNATRGFMVFTRRGTNLSDQLANHHFEQVQQATNKAWYYRSDESDGDKDYEANFQLLRETDVSRYSPYFAAMLEEWGFHSSLTDARFIVSSKGRAQRIEAAIKTAIWAKTHLFNHLK
ncbi:MAG: peptidoglycan-binding protein [Aureispira sp.]